MAKIQTLKDRETGATLYPETTAEAVYFPDGSNAAAKVEALQEAIRAKADGFTLSDDLKMSETGELSVSDKAKMALFIDMWNEAWKIGGRVYGKYDAVNAPDAGHPFMGNDVWMTYEEALEGLQNYDNRLNGQIQYSNARTLRPFVGNIETDINGICYYCNKLETVRILNYYIVNNGADPDNSIVTINNTRDAFVGCRSLKEVRGILGMTGFDQMQTHFYNAFTVCENLEILWLHSIRLNTNLRALRRLKLECLLYMIEHAANTAPITITLHPEAYARVTDEIFAAALEKDITIASA